MNITRISPARRYADGIGDATANRTVNRKIFDLWPYAQQRQLPTMPRDDSRALDDQVTAMCKSLGIVFDGYKVKYGDDATVDVSVNQVGEMRRETWADVALRVSKGNTSLHPKTAAAEFPILHHHMRQASILLSGRHLQHGDETQPQRNMEVFTNCSTAAMSYLSFYLLLNGSGVGRAYNDDLMLVDWRKMPIAVPCIREDHPDVISGEIEAPTVAQAKRQYPDHTYIEFVVPDSREGWSEAIELMEVTTYFGQSRDSVLLLDFSQVRERGQPIAGMQDRPASGPGPLMSAIENVARLRDSGMEPWLSNMYVDHYFAECVLVGGARRAARMACKYWKDKSVIDFINCKADGGLWSANNSILVDDEFWSYVKGDHTDTFGEVSELAKHALAVFEAATKASYYDGTGEPGFINQHKLTRKDEGLDRYENGEVVTGGKLKMSAGAREIMSELARVVKESALNMIVNPCGEITLLMLGGYCVIADVVPYHATDLDDAEDAFRCATRALIRTNRMDSLYKKEVRRTNRIGVGFTGIHEFAYKFFGYGFRDLIDEEKSMDFWQSMKRFALAVDDEARKYSKTLRMPMPHTTRTVKPAGTTSKLFGLSEGVHLPAMREYLRWVQFRSDDPLVEEYRKQGYPIRSLETYKGTTIIGFPTQLEICKLGMGDKLVTAAEATPSEQYQWLKLLEKYWIDAGEENTGNQISYTLKLDLNHVSYEDYCSVLRMHQSEVKCCSVLPISDMSAYEYLPEESVTKAEYERIAKIIERGGEIEEDIGLEHVDCSSGACPIDFRSGAA